MPRVIWKLKELSYIGVWANYCIKIWKSVKWLLKSTKFIPNFARLAARTQAHTAYGVATWWNSALKITILLVVLLSATSPLEASTIEAICTRTKSSNRRRLILGMTVIIASWSFLGVVFLVSSSLSLLFVYSLFGC